jgi:hypothetical protein
MDAPFYIHEQVAILNYSVARRCYRRLNRVPAHGIRIIVEGLSYHFFNLLFKDWPVKGLPKFLHPSKGRKKSTSAKKQAKAGCGSGTNPAFGVRKKSIHSKRKRESRHSSRIAPLCSHQQGSKPHPGQFHEDRTVLKETRELTVLTNSPSQCEKLEYWLDFGRFTKSKANQGFCCGKFTRSHRRVWSGT